MSALAIGQAPHRDLAEDGAEYPFVVGLHRPAGHPVGVGDAEDALFLVGSQLEVALQGQALHLAAVESDALFQLGMRHPGGLVALEEADHRLQPGTALFEGVCGGSPGPRHRYRPALAEASRATSSANPALPCSSTRDLATR